MRGMRSFGSVLTCSGWGFSHIERFLSAQDVDTGERKGFHLGDTLRVLELSVLYTIRVGPWRRAAPKSQDGSTRRCERLCEITRLPPVIPTELERALLYGGGFAAFLEDGNLVSQPSPLGEGAPQGDRKSVV